MVLIIVKKLYKNIFIVVLNLNFYFEMEVISYTLGCKTNKHTSFLTTFRKSQNSSHLEGNFITVLYKDIILIFILEFYTHAN